MQIPETETQYKNCSARRILNPKNKRHTRQRQTRSLIKVMLRNKKCGIRVPSMPFILGLRSGHRKPRSLSEQAVVMKIMMGGSGTGVEQKQENRKDLTITRASSSKITIIIITLKLHKQVATLLFKPNPNTTTTKIIRKLHVSLFFNEFDL